MPNMMFVHSLKCLPCWVNLDFLMSVTLDQKEGMYHIQMVDSKFLYVSLAVGESIIRRCKEREQLQTKVATMLEGIYKAITKKEGE